MGKNTLSTTVIKNYGQFELVWLDLRVQISKRNETHYSWRASGSPEEAAWHLELRDAIGARP